MSAVKPFERRQETDELPARDTGYDDDDDDGGEDLGEQL
jgi:hypothetical protein